MPLGRPPIGSWGKRSVYKTEFDLFKQNSDLDLISLASYNDDGREFIGNYFTREADISEENEVSEKDKSSGGKRKESKVKLQARNSLTSRCSNRSSRQSEFSRRKECRSASSVYRKSTENEARSRCHTSHGARACVPVNASRNVSVFVKAPNTGSKGKNDKKQTSQVFKRSKSASSILDRKKQTKSKTGQKDNGNTCLSAREARTSIDSTIRSEPVSFTKSDSYAVTTVVNNYLMQDDNSVEIDKPSEKEFVLTNRHCASISTANEDNVDSKDSGFLSDGVTPEPERKLSDLSELKSATETVEPKRVTFNLQSHGYNDTDTQSDADSNVEDKDRSVDCVSLSDSDGAYEKNDNVSSSLPNFGVNDLIGELQSVRCLSALSYVSIGSRNNKSVIDSEINSLCGFTDERLKETSQPQISGKEVDDEREVAVTSKKSISVSMMSTEARSAILETLQDMRGKASRSNKENQSTDLAHKSVGKQRRMKDNRSKYDQFMREKTSINDSKTSPLYPQYETLEAINDNAHATSNEMKLKLHDDLTTDDSIKGPLFPSIGEQNRRSKKSAGSSQKHSVYSLEQVKKKKYKIPGIGNYDLVMSPDSEFEITPPGFDSRYDVGSVIPKEEQEPPPPLIRERSILKCKKWLKNISLSPMSLHPTKQSEKR